MTPEEATTNLFYAIQIGNYEYAAKAISGGANVNGRQALRQGWPERTPLQEAAAKGYAKIVQLLIDNGADVNATFEGK